MRSRKSVRHLMEEMTMLGLSTLVEREKLGFHSGLKPPNLMEKDLLTVAESRNEAAIILGPLLNSELKNWDTTLGRNHECSAVSDAFNFSLPKRDEPVRDSKRLKAEGSTLLKADAKRQGDRRSSSSKTDKGHKVKSGAWSAERKSCSLPHGVDEKKSLDLPPPAPSSILSGCHTCESEGGRGVPLGSQLSDRALKAADIVVAPMPVPLGLGSGSLSADLRSTGTSSAQDRDRSKDPAFKIIDKTSLFFSLDAGAACEEKLEVPAPPTASEPAKRGEVENLGYSMWPYHQSSDLDAVKPFPMDVVDNPEETAIYLAAFASMSSEVAAAAKQMVDEFPGILVRLKAEVSELREQIEVGKKALVDSQAAHAMALQENNKLKAALEDSQRRAEKLQEEVTTCTDRLATTAKERDDERDRSIILSRGLAKAVRQSMESAGAVLQDPEPEYTCPKEWASLAERRLKSLQGIGEKSSRSLATAAAMASAATVAIGLNNTDLGTAISCLEAGCSQVMIQSVRDKHDTLKPAAKKFVDGLIKAITEAERGKL